ncbi:GTPase activator activity protein [Tritrichomonas musculus]|uniref:GTPase activator activity protein n=1 Tax=Tritrichomonas musculus TaxID=1915356 RepID=A0ABR2H599_9EUKA
MDSLNKVDDQWIPLQVKVFSRWVSSKLQGHSNVKVEDITKDLSNGVALCDLATYLTHKNAPRSWSHDPKRTVDMVQNCELAVDMFDKDGVRLVGISGKDINDNNQKLILGLVWSLILHYQIGASFDIDNSNGKENTVESVANNITTKNQKEALLSWASERTANYPYIHNFQPFDLSLCALLDTYVPEKINYYKLDPKDSQHNSELATNVMHDLGIPVFVYPEDLQKHDNIVDEKTLLTQLSTAKVVLDKRPKEDLSHLLAAEEASKLADEAAADAEDGNNNDDYDDEADNGPEPTNTENPEWVIDDDAVDHSDVTNPGWTNQNENVEQNRPLGDQSNKTDSLIDLSVVPQQNQSASILASGAEWVKNDATNAQAMETRPAESAQNLIDFSGTSDEQPNTDAENNAEADSKLVQERSVTAEQNDENENQSENHEDEDESDSEDYNDAVLVWENKNLDTGSEEPTWIIGDDDADVILLPDHHSWELDSEPRNGIEGTNQSWVISDEEAAAQSASGDENGEDVLDWVVADEPVADQNGEGEAQENVEPAWVIVDPEDSYGLLEPSVQRWEIDDATAEAIKVRVAEESLEEAILSREVSFPEPDQHGRIENNDESAADYSSKFMFVDVKSWF